MVCYLKSFTIVHLYIVIILCVQKCVTVKTNVEILLSFVWVMYLHQCAVQCVFCLGQAWQECFV